MSTEEPRYTLDEARRELARRECAIYGHSYDHITNGRGGLLTIVCSRCAAAWNVTPA